MENAFLYRPGDVLIGRNSPVVVGALGLISGLVKEVFLATVDLGRLHDYQAFIKGRGPWPEAGDYMDELNAGIGRTPWCRCFPVRLEEPGSVDRNAPSPLAFPHDVLLGDLFYEQKSPYFLSALYAGMNAKGDPVFMASLTSNQGAESFNYYLPVPSVPDLLSRENSPAKNRKNILGLRPGN